ncbi:MAG: nuclear transport factor 2 family protein [Chitinophagales bacterium]|nr:nuclear transport factor 2 family protein [Chitinophagales bacterium]
MKLKTILLFAFLLLSKSIFPQSALNEIKAFEKERYQALINADIATTTKLISPDLLYTHSNLTFEDKEAYLLALKSGKYKFESFFTDSTQYVFLNKKTVIAAGLVHMQGRYFDTPYKLDGRFTAVYIKRKKQWQLAAWQTTKKVN